MLSAKFVKTCTPLTSLIGRLLSGFSATSVTHLITVSRFVAPFYLTSLPSQMPIGPAVLMTVAAPVATVSSLALPWSPGAPASNLQLLDPPRRPNTNLLPILPPNCYGFNLSFTNLVFFSPNLPPSGVTIWVRPIFLSIRSSIPGQSMWILIFISSETVLLMGLSLSPSFPVKTSWLTSLPSLSQSLVSVLCVQTSLLFFYHSVCGGMLNH